MATKNELIVERNRYLSLLQRALAELQNNRFFEAIELAVESLAFVNGTFQYERKQLNNDAFDFPTHEIIFQYAPRLFHFRSLNAVRLHLDQNKQLEKSTKYEFRKRLQDARDEMAECLALWKTMETTREINNLSYRCKRAIELWSQIGLIVPDQSNNNNTWIFAFDYAALYRGKCSQCGAVSNAKKSSLLKKMKCPKCNTMSALTIIGPKTVD